MLSAQDSPMGVPKEMLEAKKLELQQEQVRRYEASSGSKRLTCLCSSRKRPPSPVAKSRLTKMTS